MTEAKEMKPLDFTSTSLIEIQVSLPFLRSIAFKEYTTRIFSYFLPFLYLKCFPINLNQEASPLSCGSNLLLICQESFPMIRHIFFRASCQKWKVWYTKQKKSAYIPNLTRNRYSIPNRWVSNKFWLSMFAYSGRTIVYKIWLISGNWRIVRHNCLHFDSSE